MRNLLTLVALFVSILGMTITVTREEIRCWIGLSSNICQSLPQALPSLSKPQLPSVSSPETESAEKPRPASPAVAPSPSPQIVEKAEQILKETSVVKEMSDSSKSSKVEASVPAAKDIPPVLSQPIEVIPPPEETSQPSQPIEVIPPP